MPAAADTAAAAAVTTKQEAVPWDVLGARRQAILRFIAAEQAARPHRSPSAAEIGRAVGIGTRSGVREQLLMLEAYRWISRADRQIVILAPLPAEDVGTAAAMEPARVEGAP